MNFKITSSRTGKVREVDFARPRTLVATALVALAVASMLFGAGLGVGSYIAGPLRNEQLARALDAERLEIDAARSQLQGKVDAIASRVGMMNAHLIRLDALGRRIADLANLRHGEFDFDKPPPAGGPDTSEQVAGTAQVPELTAVLDALEAQLADRERQLTVLESLMSTRQLGQRILPGGLPVVGGWISSLFGFRADPITGRPEFHPGID